MRLVLIQIFFLSIVANNLFALGKQPCLDPFSTVDWEFFFDELEIGTYGDDDNDDNPFCACVGNSNVPDAGLKMHVTEPIGFITLNDIPFHFPCFQKESPNVAKQKMRGSGQGDGKNTSGTYRNAHYITYPVFAVINVLLDKICVSEGSIGLPFIGEVETEWFSDYIANILQPENKYFNNPIALSACLADCVQSTAHKANDGMFWCNGCWIPMQNATGRVPGNTELIESTTLATRVLNWMSMTLRLRQTESLNAGVPFNPSGASSNDIACGKPEFYPKLVKHSYYLQPAYPIASSPINIGRMPLGWSFFKNAPSYDDRIFVVWRSRYCCWGVVHTVTGAEG